MLIANGRSYNSTLFITWSTNAYSAFVAHDSFAQPGNITVQLSSNPIEAAALGYAFGTLAQQLHEKAVDGQLQKLSPKDCIEAYAVPLQSRRRNVVLISSTETRRTADVFDVFHAWIPTEHPNARGEQYSWICDDKLGWSDQCLYHVNDLKANPKNWTVSDDAHIDYCLSETTEEHCKLQVSLGLALVSLFTILSKVILMFAVAIHVTETPLMTTGDAIESFMRDPDPYTEGMCMATKRMIEESSTKWPQHPIYVKLQKFRWGHGIKTRVMTGCLL